MIDLNQAAGIYICFVKFIRTRISVNYCPIVYWNDIYVWFIILKFCAVIVWTIFIIFDLSKMEFLLRISKWQIKLFTDRENKLKSYLAALQWRKWQLCLHHVVETLRQWMEAHVCNLLWHIWAIATRRYFYKILAFPKNLFLSCLVSISKK